MDPATTRLAVLIDADNTSPKHVQPLLEELAQYGRATVKRAYGDWTTPQLGGWKGELNRHAIAPMQQFSYTTGKNSTDSALIIDTMDLLYSDNLDAFAIVSSDSDFTRLATRLRESGKTVYGLGLRKTPESLRAACDQFIYLELLGDQPETTVAPEPDAEVTQLPNLQSLLTKAVNATAQDDGWATLSALGNYLRAANASFDSRLYGRPKLISLAQEQPYLDVDTSARSARVRLKSKKTPAKKTVAKPATKEPGTKEPAAKKAAAPRQRTTRKVQSTA